MAYILDSVRSTFGRLDGHHSNTRPDDLAAQNIRVLLERNTVEDSEVGDVILGCSNQSGEDSRNVARVSLLLAGMSHSVPGVTVNRLCGSGMEAFIQASRAIRSGDLTVCIAGGVESMSRSPRILPQYPRRKSTTNLELISTTVGWRQPNPAFPSDWNVTNVESAQIIATRFGINRESQDTYSYQSHIRAGEAWERGLFEGEVFSTPDTQDEMDENIRRVPSLDALANLKSVTGGSITAGNSSAIADGSAMVLLGNREAALEHGAIGKVIGYAHSANSPDLFGISPVDAIRKVLDSTNLTLADLNVIEIGEAFAAQVLACTQLLPGLSTEAINERGGGISIGHPLGASGARLIGHVAHRLRERGGGIGLASMCIGMGQAIAILISSDVAVK